ncbi:hypothetical protein [Saccharothrix syringae]|uniref:Uncharacterized protein n=1 Tax=Saccharothrix syringae TaxID=103733 RepID=A0A5Q0GT42_SACSY|nr:hypothetical protein [Saccharothrix syringae]QFZ17071.1 hypothetical protein EKG83_05930 [Saccharothrix syringae]
MELPEIAGFVADYRSGNDFALVDCLRRLAAPEFLRPLLARGATGEVPDRAYRHPNGFLKIVLVSNPEFQLRLHVWRPAPEYPAPTENVHNHRWDFASAVLAGGYRFQEYVPDARGEDFLGFRYGGHRGTSSYALAPTGDARLRCTFDADLSSGSSYLLTSDVLHRVVSPADRTTVSMILQGPHKDAPVEVYAKHALRSGEDITLDPLPREQVARELGHVLDLL